MLKRLTSTDPDVQMPPPDSNRNLGAADRAKLAQWLKAGAVWPKDDRHWAFVPPKKEEISDKGNPIDVFIGSKLKAS